MNAAIRINTQYTEQYVFIVLCVEESTNLFYFIILQNPDDPKWKIERRPIKEVICSPVMSAIEKLRKMSQARKKEKEALALKEIKIEFKEVIEKENSEIKNNQNQPAESFSPKQRSSIQSSAANPPIKGLKVQKQSPIGVHKGSSPRMSRHRKSRPSDINNNQQPMNELISREWPQAAATSQIGSPGVEEHQVNSYMAEEIEPNDRAELNNVAAVEMVEPSPPNPVYKSTNRIIEGNEQEVKKMTYSAESLHSVKEEELVRGFPNNRN